MPQTPPQTDTYSTALDIFDRTHPLRVDIDENLKVVGTFTPSGTQDVNIVGSVPIPVTQSGAWTVSLTSESIEIGKVDQGTGGVSPWLIDGSVSITNFPAVQSVSGTVTANQGTSPWVISGAVTANAGTNLNTSALALNTTLTSGSQRSQLVDGSGNVATIVPLVSSLTGTELGVVTNSLIYGKTTGGGGGYVEVKVNPSGALTADVSGSSVSVSNFPATQPVSGTVAVSNFPATQNVAVISALPTGANVIGHVIADNGSTTTVTGNVTVIQPTGTSLHAVIDSGTVTLSGTSPVSGTVTSNQGTSPWVVSGTVTANAGTGTFLVDGSAHTQPVSGTVTANAGTGTFLVDGSAHTQPISGTVTATQTTGTNLHAVIDSGTVTLSGTSPVSGTVTVNQGTPTTPANKWPVEIVDSGGVNIATVDAAGDVQVDVNNFPATVAVTQSTSPWVVSGTVTANAGSGNFTVTQSTGANLHTVLDSGTTTVTQATGTNLHTVVDSGTLTAVMAITNALPAGSNVIGHVIADSGSTTIVTGNVTVVQSTGTNLHTVVDSGTVAATQSGAWTIGRTWTLASGTDSISAVQSGTWTVQPGNTPNTSPWLIEQRAPNTLASYSASTLGLVMAATPTDIFTIYGSGTKTVKITRIEISATQNTAAIRDIVLIKRSATNTGGTSSAPTIVSHDSNNAVATATVLAYTVNPASLGASVGNIRTAKMDIPATNLVGSSDRIIWLFGDRPSQAIVLRGTSQGIAINMNSVTSSSSSFDIVVEWTEE